MDIGYRLPCREGDPDDWFIGPDGKQYPSDDLLEPVDYERATKMTLWLAGETQDQHDEREQKVIDRMRRDRRTEALGRRRRAREACLDCPVRDACLDSALDAPDIDHGIRGGLYPDELRKMLRRR